MKIKPFSPKQLKVMTWWKHPVISQKYDAVIADGSIRSGKTVSMSLSFVLWAMSTFNGCSFAFCGKTVGSCRRNVITPLLSLVNFRYQVKDLRSENKIVIRKGKTENIFYIFGGKDESSQDLIQGITLAGVMLDEVALMPRSFVDQATGRCSVDGSRLWFNCNPDNPYHWFYQEWIQQADKKKALYLHFTMDDNLTLSQSVKDRYFSLYTGNYFERYIKGLWVAAEGLVYPNFSKEEHVVPTVQRYYTRYFVSIDYGTLNPFSAGLWGLYQGHWYRVKEYYYNGRALRKQKTDAEYYRDIDEFIGNLRVEALIVDPSAASFIAEVQKHGKYVVRKARNDVLNGIRFTSTCLLQKNILFNDCCESTFKEFASYVWDADASKSGVDTVRKENDHAMDDIRYFCYTILKDNALPGFIHVRG